MALATSCSEVEPPTRPDRIILISMDTVRADRVSGYGAADTTPELAAIASEGRLFRDFYGASNYTLPSHMSLFTGRDPKAHGVDTLHGRLAPVIPTLTELLAKAGYRTRGFHEGGYVAARFGFDRGFEQYSRNDRVSLVRDGLDDVVDWMKGTTGSPYFLFVHTYAAHEPYGGLERYREEDPDRRLASQAGIQRRIERLQDKPTPMAMDRIEKRDELRELMREQTLLNYLREPDEPSFAKLYLGAEFAETEHFERDRAQLMRSYDLRIGEIDAAIGRIKSTLVELGEWEGTLLIVTSDHGEAFFEHGTERHDYSPFNEVLKIPLIVSYPRVISRQDDHVVEGLAWHLDLMPTILSLAGVPRPDGLSGLDLTPMLVGDSRIDDGREIFPATLRTPTRPKVPLRRVALSGSHKWIEGHELFGDEEGFLFRLDVDPEEKTNVRIREGEVFAALRSAASAYDSSLTRVPPESSAPSGDTDPDASELSGEFLEDMRALGYVE